MTKNPHHHRVFELLRLTAAFIIAVNAALPSDAAKEEVPSDLQKARQLLHTPQVYKSIAQARAVLAKNPNSAEWQQFMAQCFMDRDNFLALKYAEKALSLKPKDAGIMATYALALLKLQGPQRAIRVASRAARIDPLNGLALAILGTCDQQTEQAALAQELFARATELSPFDFDVNLLAIRYYETALDDRSNLCAERLVKSFPNSPLAFMTQGKLRRKQEDAAQGLVDFDRALALDPTLISAHYERGKLLQRLERDKEAIPEFDKVIESDPTSPNDRFRRAESLLKVGQLKRALVDLNDAVRLANPPGQNDPSKYAPSQTRMSKKDYVLCWSRRLNVETRLGYQEMVVADTTEILRVDPANDGALAIRQALLRKEGRNLEALADLDKLLKLNPEISDWHEARAEVYQKLNRPTEAAKDLAVAKYLDQYGKLPSAP
jgi:tetratricopeptide (TPR) repeat protein